MAKQPEKIATATAHQVIASVIATTDKDLLPHVLELIVGLSMAKLGDIRGDISVTLDTEKERLSRIRELF